ncbi:hypothetical protein BaRGS_00001472, partial [Batillaria attramentaria]
NIEHRRTRHILKIELARKLSLCCAGDFPLWDTAQTRYGTCVYTEIVRKATQAEEVAVHLTLFQECRKAEVRAVRDRGCAVAINHKMSPRARQGVSLPSCVGRLECMLYGVFLTNPNLNFKAPERPFTDGSSCSVSAINLNQFKRHYFSCGGTVTLTG